MQWVILKCDRFYFINIDYYFLYFLCDYDMRHRQCSIIRNRQVELEIIPNNLYRLEGSDVLSTKDYDVLSSNVVGGTTFQQVISVKAATSGHYYCKGKQIIKNQSKFGNYLYI